MKARVDILATERKESVYDGGRKSVSFVAQCVCHLDKVQVGEARIPEALCPRDGDGNHHLPLGSYIFEYGLNVNWQTKKLEGQLKAIEAVKPGSAAAPSAGAKAAA